MAYYQKIVPLKRIILQHLKIAKLIIVEDMKAKTTLLLMQMVSEIAKKVTFISKVFNNSEAPFFLTQVLALLHELLQIQQKYFYSLLKTTS